MKVDKLWALTGPPVSSTRHFLRAQRGLFAGDRIRFGDSVSSPHGNRSRRAWRPNVQGIPLFSEALGAKLRVRVTPTALGLVEQAGGIDTYLRAQRVPESRMAASLRERILLQDLFRIPPADLAQAKIPFNPAQPTALKQKRPPPMVKPTLAALNKDVSLLIKSRLTGAASVPSSDALYCPC